MPHNDIEAEVLEIARKVPLPNASLDSPAPNRGSPIWLNAPMLRGSTNFEPKGEIKNIMITGGAGFIASWVARSLTLTYRDHYNIVSFDKLDYCATLNNTMQLDGEQNFDFYKGDITSTDDVMGCLRKHNVDTVLHFAAQSHVDLSFGNSYHFTLTNVLGTHVLLECIKKHGIRKFIHVSTDEVYGEVKDGEDDLLENSKLAPTNPYAASKAAAEQQVHAYYKSFGIPVIMVRSNNVYGPRNWTDQFPEKVIPKFILMLQRQQKLTLHGNGLHTRRYLYAGDAADAFDTVLHKGEVGSIYNVGSRDEISNKDLCVKLLEHFGLPNQSHEDLERHVLHTVDRPFNDHRYAVDGTKLRKLGWEQKTSFEEGLRITVDWYREFGTQWWGDIECRLTPFPEIPKQENEKWPVQRHRPSNGSPLKVVQNGTKRCRSDDWDAKGDVASDENGFKRIRGDEVVMGAQIEAP